MINLSTPKPRLPSTLSPYRTPQHLTPKPKTKINMISAQSFLTLLSLLSTLSLQISAKTCTNGMTDNIRFHSHTLRSQHNSQLSKHIINELSELSLPHTIQRKQLYENANSAMYENANSAMYENRNATFLSEVSLHDVRLDRDSMYGQAQQTNLEYLLMLDVDRLVWSFRKLAGVSAAGNPYGGWEGPEVELRGHFVGHYLSASAQMWASTHNDTIYQQMSLVVDALQECQRTIGTGYLSAFPSELFDRIEALDYAWAPYYTIHKIMAGLLDQHLLANSDKALEMVVWMAEYFVNRVKNVIQLYSIERHWMSLNEETGGMNDVLYRLYSVTNDKKHLILAHLFDKPCFLGLLAVEADSLSEFHSNTHIPLVVGAQMRYEMTGDPLYKEISMFFMDSVNSSHSYATGGTSVGEYWTDPKRLADKLSTETQESCTTYNMLKVSRNLFRWTRKMEYADYYERALMNGVLSIQRGRDPGVMIYMLPLGPGQSKAHSYHGWGTQFNSFWCCYGTGIESFSKLGDSIYFEDKSTVPSLYLIQYIPSSFSWSSGGIALHQTMEPVTSLDPFLRVTIEVFAYESTNNQPSTLNLRIPYWTSIDEMEVALNSQLLQLPYPGSFLSLTETWTSKEILSFKMPIILRTEAIKDDRPKYSSIQAILFGPYLLAGLTSGDWDIKTGNSSSITDWVIPIPPSYHSQLISLTQDLNSQTFVLSYSDGSLKMEDWPKEGTNSALHGTFRIFTEDFKEVAHILNSKVGGETSVMLEPFHLPGKAIGHQGPHKGLAVTTSQTNTLFKLIGGLDGKPGTVSLESSSHPGCFVSSLFYYSAGQRVQLNCMGDSVPDILFQSAASFSLIAGIRQYNPISFLAKGVRQDIILEPLLSLKDENYTAYFNIQA